MVAVLGYDVLTCYATADCAINSVKQLLDLYINRIHLKLDCEVNSLSFAAMLVTYREV